MNTTSTTPTAKPVMPCHFAVCSSGLNVVKPTIPNTVAAIPHNKPNITIPTIENIKLSKQQIFSFLFPV